MSTVVKYDGDCGKTVQYISNYYIDEIPLREVLPLKFDEKVVTTTEHVRKGKPYSKTHCTQHTYNFCSWQCVWSFAGNRQ